MEPLTSVSAKTARQTKRAVPIADPGSPLFTGTHDEVQLIQPFKGSSSYEDDAHRGTVTDKARAYWLKVLDHDPGHGTAKTRTLTVEEYAQAKTDVYHTRGLWIEVDLLYPLIRGRDVGRFCHRTDDWYILVPNEHYSDMLTEEQFSATHPLAYRYLGKNRDVLLERATYKRYQRTKPFYAIFDVGEYTFAPHKVVWIEQPNPASFRAAVISDHPASIVPNTLLVPDHKLYMLSLHDATEAHYVCAVLNSKHLRLILGGFLEGKQIGTTIFRYIGLPPYDPDVPLHADLAAVSLRAHATRQGTKTTANLPRSEQRQLDDMVRELFDAG